MEKSQFILDFREKRTIKSWVLEILLFFTSLSLLNYFFVGYNISQSIISALIVMFVFMFIFNPIRHWLIDRKEKKLKEKNNYKN